MPLNPKSQHLLTLSASLLYLKFLLTWSGFLPILEEDYLFPECGEETHVGFVLLLIMRLIPARWLGSSHLSKVCQRLPGVWNSAQRITGLFHLQRGDQFVGDSEENIGEIFMPWNPELTPSLGNRDTLVTEFIARLLLGKIHSKSVGLFSTNRENTPAEYLMWWRTLKFCPSVFTI